MGKYGKLLWEHFCFLTCEKSEASKTQSKILYEISRAFLS